MQHIKAFLFPLVSAAALAQNPVDLSTWASENYAAVAGFGNGNWAVASANTTVTQSVNGQPTLFYSPFQAAYLRTEGHIQVTGSDDDYVGFAIGFQPGDSTNANADYLLLDWKRASQSFNFGAPSCTPGSVANAGLAVSRVEGLPTADEFWGHVDLNTTPCSGPTDRVTELQRGATLGSTGWVRNQTYLFRIDFSPSRLVVAVDGVPQIDVSGSFRDGRLAFYNFSQAGVIYSLFTTDCLAAWNNYGAGFPGMPLGVPTLAASAAPLLGTQIGIEMTSAAAVPAFAVLLYGWADTNTPSGFGGNMLAQPDVIDGLILPAAPGMALRPLNIPQNPVFCGVRVYTQFVHLDAGAAQGIAFSRGMVLSIGQ